MQYTHLLFRDIKEVHLENDNMHNFDILEQREVDESQLDYIHKQFRAEKFCINSMKYVICVYCLQC